MVSERTIERFSLYRRVVEELRKEGVAGIHSHRLAERAGASAAQVRRDLMSLSVVGHPKRGYDTADLLAGLGGFLDAPEGQNAALIGVGNLGRALLAYFQRRRPNLQIVAAFDSDPSKIGRLIHGCPCYAVEELPNIVREESISIGMLTVPASAAHEAAGRLIRAGVGGLLNFAPVHLRVDERIYVEDIDITMHLEKVAWFAREKSGGKGRS